MIPVSAQYPGVQRAVVVSTADPTKQGRVQLQIPQVLGTALSNWAEPSTPGAALPPVGSVLYVAFNNGEINRPVWFPLPVAEQAIVGLRNLVSQSIANITWISMTWDTSDLDPGNTHVAGTSKVTPVVPGWYQVNASGSFVSNVNGFRVISLLVNGANRYRGTNHPFETGSLAESTMSVSKLIYFNGTTDYVEVQLFQSVGGALATSVADSVCSFFLRREHS